MRTFDYKTRYKRVLQPDTAALIAQIHEYKGAQPFFVEENADMLALLAEIAKIESTEASNKVEGIHASDDRLKMIIRDKTMPKTKDEKIIAGYRDVLNAIYENYDYIPVKSSELLQLHRDLYKFAGKVGGSFRSGDIAAEEISAYIDEICNAYQDACNDPQCDPLVMIPMFVLDFLCVRPFSNGNDRMSCLVLLLLLERASYHVGMYISLEKLIEQTRETYLETLRQSSYHWVEEKNDDIPFVRYILEIIAAAYRDLFSTARQLDANGISKQERVRMFVRGTPGQITRAQIMEKCPNISQVTVERALTDMVKKREILKIGGGRYTSYIWNREKE